VSLQENKAARNGAKDFRIDAIQDVDTAGGIELQQAPALPLARTQLAQAVADADGHRGAAERQNTDAEGGCNMMSAPTPSMRLAVSCTIPLVSPTMTITRVTSTATASTLTIVRIGPVDDVVKNHSGRSRLRTRLVFPTRTSSVPDGCGSVKRSAAISAVQRQLGDGNAKLVILLRPRDVNLAWKPCVRRQRTRGRCRCRGPEVPAGRRSRSLCQWE
jgi:hypothetical protein